jgi:hypothetical protein
MPWATRYNRNMATTEAGRQIEAYINDRLKRRRIDAAATIVEGTDNLDLGVHMRGAVPSRHFLLKNGYADGLNDAVKKAIAEHLDELVLSNHAG